MNRAKNRIRNIADKKQADLFGMKVKEFRKSIVLKSEEINDSEIVKVSKIIKTKPSKSIAAEEITPVVEVDNLEISVNNEEISVLVE